MYSVHTAHIAAKTVPVNSKILWTMDWNFDDMHVYCIHLGLS